MRKAGAVLPVSDLIAAFQKCGTAGLMVQISQIHMQSRTKPVCSHCGVPTVLEHVHTVFK